MTLTILSPEDLEESVTYEIKDRDLILSEIKAIKSKAQSDVNAAITRFYNSLDRFNFTNKDIKKILMVLFPKMAEWAAKQTYYN